MFEHAPRNFRWEVFVREIRRLVRSLISLPSLLINRLLSTLYYDSFLSSRRMVMKGTSPLGRKLAIYVIFPKNGLLQSHLHAISYMRSNGYAPLVVSNAQLDSAERECLLHDVWRYIERPNYGYDFGAYRDGILSVEGILADLDHLALFNDSCWFPMPDSQDWLISAEALDVDFAGATMHYGFVRGPIHELMLRRDWDYGTSHRKFHYSSYAILLSAAALADAGFLRFWKRLALTADKALCVKRGEIGLSRWAIGSGLSHGSTFHAEDLLPSLRRLALADLRNEVLRVNTLGHQVLEIHRQQLLSNSHSDAKSCVNFLMSAATLFPPVYSLPDLLCERFGFPFLKKSLTGKTIKDAKAP